MRAGPLDDSLGLACASNVCFNYYSPAAQLALQGDPAGTQVLEEGGLKLLPACGLVSHGRYLLVVLDASVTDPVRRSC